jgi:hypothetical protein
MRTITPSQLTILKAIGRYKFLTISLIDTLKIFKNKVSIYRAIAPLKDGKKPLVIAHSYGLHPTKGQLESLLYLTKYGKELLVDSGIEESKIQIPINKTLVSTDYFHRVFTISTFVYMDIFLKSTSNHTIFYHYYFDKAKKEPNKRYRQAKNHIKLNNDKFIIPDAVAKFKYEDKVYLYLIEIHNGKDTNKIFVQVLNHINAINLGTPKEKYNHPKNNRVAIVFEHKSCMEALIKKISSEPKLNNYLKLFIFNSFENIKKDFNNNWLLFNSKSCNFI